jgi:hypothetical protein
MDLQYSGIFQDNGLALLMQCPFNVQIPIPDMLPEMEVKRTDINQNATEMLKWRIPT